MDFGKFLIGTIGYGFSVLMILVFWACIRDIGRAKTGDLSCGTEQKNSRMAVEATLLAFFAALITRLTLGAI